MEKMNDIAWKIFFELLRRIVNGEGMWKKKRNELIAKAKEHGAQTELEEVYGWLEGSD